MSNKPRTLLLKKLPKRGMGILSQIKFPRVSEPRNPFRISRRIDSVATFGQFLKLQSPGEESQAKHRPSGCLWPSSIKTNHISPNKFPYSLRIAASGLSLIARSAGKYPAATPTSIANPMDRITSHQGMYEIFPSMPIAAPLPVRILMTKDIRKLRIFPMTPPIRPMNAASIRNICLMFFRLQPNTLMTPISLVRS